MKKFVVSTDSCVDLYKSELEKKGVYYIVLKRITNGIETSEIYDSDAESEQFYSEIKNGALPTTSQLNFFELEEYFNKILKKEPTGDIIHVALSSGLSETCTNAQSVANKMNQSLLSRKIYVIDSLSATYGMAMQVERLIEMRDSNIDTEEAVSKITHLRDHQQAFAIISNLFHLKRGGRISGFKAAVGTFLHVRPILFINAKGKLEIDRSVKGTMGSINYVLDKVEKLKSETDFSKSTVYIAHSSAIDVAEKLKIALYERFGNNIKTKIGMIGPIIGTHVGDGSVAIVFEGCKR